MARTWVDFKKVKELATVERVAQRYQLSLKPEKGNELVGRCPFHEEKKASFRMNRDKRAFNCFGCGAKGNMLDFIARTENVSIKDAALLALEWFGEGDVETKQPVRAAEKKPVPAEEAATREPNAPLKFQLKLQADHPYLTERHVSAETASFFGLGYSSRGLMKGRIAIPIHNEKGELVAYAGRWVEGDLPEGEEKYKLPPGFKKNEVLFNLHRVGAAERLVLVEGYFSVFRLHALGVPAVALMGRTLSELQEKLLGQSQARSITVLMDGDEPGRKAAQEIVARLAKKFSVKLAELPDGAQPDTVPEDLLRELLG